MLVVSLLISKGHANCNARDARGMTPTHVAAGKGHGGVLRAMLRLTAPPRAALLLQQAAGHDPAHIPVNINIRDMAGRVPLHLAAGAGHVEALQVLIAAGAEVNHRDLVQSVLFTQRASACRHVTHWWCFPAQMRRTPAQAAAQQDHVQCLKLLGDAGAHVFIDPEVWQEPANFLVDLAKQDKHQAIAALAATGCDVNTYSTVRCCVVVVVVVVVWWCASTHQGIRVVTRRWGSRRCILPRCMATCLPCRHC